MQIRERWTANELRDLLNKMEQGYQWLGVLTVNPLEVIEGARWALAKLDVTKIDVNVIDSERALERQRAEWAEATIAELEVELKAANDWGKTTEAQLAIVSGLNEWHDLPELPLLVGHYLAFWREGGAWVAQYWPSGIEDENGNKGNWLTTPDGSIRPNPVAWRHLPSVPEKYAKQGEYFRA